MSSPAKILPVVYTGTRPSVDLDQLTTREREALDGVLQSLGSVSVVAAGAPVSRPPLFREEDSYAARGGKAILYVALSPCIICLVLWDNRLVMFDVVKRGANVLLLHPAIALVRSTGRAISTLADGTYRFVLLPAYNGSVVVAKGTHRFILLPTYNASVAVLRGARQLALALAGCSKRGSLAIMQAARCYVLRPLWNGAVAIIDATKRAIIAVAVSTKQGATSFARGVHAYVLRPLRYCSVCAYHATKRAIILPVWRVACVAASRSFKGACWLGACVQHGIGSVARVSWGWIHFAGGSLYTHILVPVHWAAATALKHTWHGTVWVAAGITRHLLKPLAELVARGAIETLRVLGNGIVVLADGASRAAGWLLHRVLVPLYAGVSALAIHSWHGVCWIVDGVWQGTKLVASAIHGYILAPIYLAGRTLVVGAWVGGCWAGKSAWTCASWVGACLWGGACSVGKGLYYHILVPMANGVTAVYRAGRFLLTTAASGLRRHVVAPLLEGARLIGVALYEGVFKPAGGAVVAGARAVKKGARAAASGVASGMRAGADSVKAGAGAIRDGVAAGAGAVRNAATAVGRAVSVLGGGHVSPRRGQPSRPSTMTGMAAPAS